MLEILGDAAPHFVDYIKMHPYNAEDCTKVRALNAGKAALRALKHPRPERCEELRDILPEPEPDTSDLQHFDHCPEVELVEFIFSNTDIADFDVLQLRLT
jgi:hypothetical protein